MSGKSVGRFQILFKLNVQEKLSYLTPYMNVNMVRLVAS